MTEEAAKAYNFATREFRRAKTKTNFPQPEENNDVKINEIKKVNCNQSPRESSTIESSSREGFSPALMVDSSPSLNLSLSHGDRFTGFGTVAARFPFQQPQFHASPAIGVLPPAANQLFYFNAIFAVRKNESGLSSRSPKPTDEATTEMVAWGKAGKIGLQYVQKKKGGNFFELRSQFVYDI